VPVTDFGVSNVLNVISRDREYNNFEIKLYNSAISYTHR
jgi:hypothetical protein